ncbi:hypothetical protein jhhlp_001761 [Lomentospora prolificans]|uniref:CFEM domain-containing protein n=1 Tax=Lomentospora prolificans TaxID=41688 RepID=A0A2N3NGT7_9PEZI|nr:hypothetical protein jhhlp_001761 [Lomentospora prolificans]
MAAFPSNIPSCAVDCLADAIKSVGCDGADRACACTPENLARLSNNRNLISCLMSSCSDPADLSEAASAGGALCADVTDSRTRLSADPRTSESRTSESRTPESSTPESRGLEPTTSQIGSTGGVAPTSTDNTMRGSETNGPSGGLSAGAKGGISVGGVIAFLLIIGLALLCCCPSAFIKRWKKRKGGGATGRDLTCSPELDGIRAELDGIPRSELEAKPATGYNAAIYPAELGGEVRVNAVPGSTSLVEAPSTYATHLHLEQRNLIGSRYGGYPVVAELSAIQQTALPPIASTISPESASPPPHGDTTSQAIEPVATAHLVAPTIDPSSAELEQLRRYQQELEARRKTLEELSRVQGQQAALQQRIDQLAAGNGVSI